MDNQKIFAKNEETNLAIKVRRLQFNTKDIIKLTSISYSNCE